MTPSHVPASAHVLAVDDDPGVLALICDLLEGTGYRVTGRAMIADDPAAVADLTPDLLLLDYRGVGVERGGLLTRLRADPRTAALPVVLCTGAVREVDELRGDLAALGARVVLKPFAIDHLVAVVAEALAAADERPVET